MYDISKLYVCKLGEVLSVKHGKTRKLKYIDK